MSLALICHVSLTRVPTPTRRQHQLSLSSSSYSSLSPSTMIMPKPLKSHSHRSPQIALVPDRVCTSSWAVLVPLPQELDQRHSRPLRGVLTIDDPLKTPLDLTRNTPIPKKSPEMDTGNDDNNDDGSGIGIGGGGSGGDDDTYHIWGDDNFDPEDDKDGNIFQKIKIFPELFDKDTIDAVLSEWMKTAKDLPAGVRAAYDLGLFSSIQFTRFLCFSSWPTILRFFCRSLPATMSAFFNGKLIADPSLPSKLLLEMVSSSTLSVWLAFENRGKDVDTMKKEWDIILMNAITASISNLFVSFWLAPCCLFSYGSKFQWQKALGKLPQNAFERSYKFKKFDIQKRVLAFLSKGVSLFMVGFATKGAAQTILFLSTDHPVKNKAYAAFDHGLFLALNSNLRHQIVWGLDRFLFEYFDVMGVALSFNFAARISNAWIGAAKQENQNQSGRGGLRIFQFTHLSTNWSAVKRKRKKKAILSRTT